MRIVLFFAGLALVVLHICVAPPRAYAQEKPDFWAVATAAGASAQTNNDPHAATLLLAPAHDVIAASKADDVRVALARLQLMLAYVEAGQIDLFKKTYGGLKLIEFAQFDVGLGPYADTASRLANSCDSRRTDQDDPTYKDYLRHDWMIKCAQYLSEIEVALRQKAPISSEAPIRLAQALGIRGVIHAHGEAYGEAVEMVQQAFTQLLSLREERAAIAAADQAFTTPPSQSDRRNPVADDPLAGYIVASSDEPAITLIGIKQSLAGADEAMSDPPAGKPGDPAASTQSKDDGSKAKAFLDIAGKFAGLAFERHAFMRKSGVWPCNPNIGMLHYWLAKYNETELRYLKKYTDKETARIEKAASDGRTEWQRAIAVFASSEGASSDRVMRYMGEYAALLRATGSANQADDWEHAAKAGVATDLAKLMPNSPFGQRCPVAAQ